MKFGYLQSRGWTPLEVRIWLLALVAVITLATLVATGVVGSWALLVACAIAAAFGLMRYRTEAEQKRRNADDQGE
jgi:Flp pilus assembly protein TadB